MTTGCECTEPGWCERHQCNKTPQWHRLCQTSQKYFDAYEQGRGPGQFDSLPPPSSTARTTAVTAAPPPGPGTELKKLLGCCSFPYVQRLNEWGPDECENRLEEIVAMLLKKSCKTKNGLTDHSARRMVGLAIEKSRRAMV